MGGSVEERLRNLASRQHGLVTRAQLLALGMTPRMVERRIQAGRFFILHRGVYRTGTLGSPHEREMAGVLACGPGAVVSHRSAAALFGVRPRLPSSKLVETLVPGRDASCRRGILSRSVAHLPPSDVTTVHRIPVTTVERTVIDLAGVVDLGDLERTVALAEKQNLITREALSRAVERRRGRPGAPLLRAVLELEGGPALTRSEAEDRFLALVERAGLPRPEVNVWVADYQVDCFWRSHRIVVEVDGYRYHSSKRQFRNDRRRNSRLAAQGYHLIRLSWDQIVDEPLATAAELALALGRAAKDLPD